MQDMHRHIAAGNDKYRYVMTRHSGILSYLRNNKKVFYFNLLSKPITGFMSEQDFCLILIETAIDTLS